eukprot:TRINITY_DN90801_c0_g1_i1.p1 TRINITY_DN90801_c0_g1~~TRINITY_DN90801_c0_g1_i1.p1  ORF type:complete len:262 (+),score=39.26 TRINITY_DN90801_c0_g1_i1:63-788(+)
MVFHALTFVCFVQACVLIAAWCNRADENDSDLFEGAAFIRYPLTRAEGATGVLLSCVYFVFVVVGALSDDTAMFWVAVGLLADVSLSLLALLVALRRAKGKQDEQHAHLEHQSQDQQGPQLLPQVFGFAREPTPQQVVRCKLNRKWRFDDISVGDRVEVVKRADEAILVFGPKLVNLDIGTEAEVIGKEEGQYDCDVTIQTRSGPGLSNEVLKISVLDIKRIVASRRREISPDAVDVIFID